MFDTSPISIDCPKRTVDVSVKRNTRTNRKPSICFVALNAYNVISGREDMNHTGGAEVQQLQIASWFVQKGYSVSFVTLDHVQPDGVNINGIKVYKAYAKDAGVRGLRFVHPRWSGLWAAMARANADVYYQRSAEAETGQVALWCRLHGRKFIFAAASDPDCGPSLFVLKSWREKTLYRIGLRLADTIVAQTATQQRLLWANMKVDSLLVPNCGWDLTDGSLCEQPLTNAHHPLRVLWVGRISEEKRFEWLLDVAEQCPDILFEVVGLPRIHSTYGSSLMKRATGIHNVKMHGYVPYQEIAKYYQQCNILCCTSTYEGFPNTFMEAWTIGMPVVSTFDPDGVIVSNGLGWVAQDIEGIVACLRKIIQSPKIWRKASKAARQYYIDNHSVKVVMPKFESIFVEISGRT